MADTDLSPHFALSEFTRSPVAARLGRAVVPSPEAVEALKALCHYVLEPIRVITGPLHVVSGYRPPWLNAAVGGSPTSDHMAGLAADLISPTMGPLALANAAYSLHDLPFKQLILEFGEWVHVSFSLDFDAPPARQVLTASRGYTTGKGAGIVVYREGLWGVRA